MGTRGKLMPFDKISR